MRGYDKYIIAFSGGKDSIACFLYLLQLGIPVEDIELWHHDIDGRGDVFMDWECTPAYCQAFAAAFGVKLYFSWKHGGFKGEMLRENQLTAPIFYEDEFYNIHTVGGTRGKLSTRRKFPQVTPDLSQRWCSAYLKIDVGSAALRNQPRFNNSRTLFISGERGEESAARARYAEFEIDRADCRGGKLKRHVDRWRPIKDWTEQQVWEIIERHKVRCHPAYYLGWSRVSCKFCIFGNADQFASAFFISPFEGNQISNYESEFNTSIKRTGPLASLIAKGRRYKGTNNTKLVREALSLKYTQSIILPKTEKWALPAGAYGDGCGPS